MLRLSIAIFFLAGSFAGIGQVNQVTVSGIVKDRIAKNNLSYGNVVIKHLPDSSFVAGTVTGDDGRFKISGIKPGNYVMELSFLGYATSATSLLVGKLSEYLDLGIFELSEASFTLNEVIVAGTADAVNTALDKKTFIISDVVNQRGGSLLQVLQNLPGVTVHEGKVRVRESDKVAVLIDGKQTALTGFGNQTSLDNIPASAIDKIEIINNPSAKYDANGNAGIINILFRKEVDDGFNGTAGLSVGAGALWKKRPNLPGIRPQYQRTPKFNPSLSLNFRKKKVNLFLQADNLYTRTLNKNEFVDRYYNNGDTIRQQTKRNRDTNLVTAKGGSDWYVNEHNIVSISGLYSSEKILDRGDEPFFNGDNTKRLRLWQFLEDELKTTVTASANWQHKFAQPGRMLDAGLNYTFHREDEKYFFTNIFPTYTGIDSFKLISDEHVTDFNVDYIQPLRSGRFETGLKFRNRYIPTNMLFIPGLNSPLDVNAGGWANYMEVIPAVYGNYVYESKHVEVEAGLRVEYVNIYYKVNPDHTTYSSDGYHYTQPFPNLRFGYKFDDANSLSVFYSRRVDRPNEVDIRIFPKYDDAEIIKVGNPSLRPQFTNSIEIGWKNGWQDGYLYSAFYRRNMSATITRISSVTPGSNLIYNVFQNAGNSSTTGAELLVAHSFGKRASINLNLNGYKNIVEAFTVVNLYPVESTFSALRQEIYSGSIKLNGLIHLPGQLDLQLASVYLAPDIVPQGKTMSRFSMDFGVKKAIQNGKGEVYLNAADVGNTLRVKREVSGDGFRYISTDYYETQVVRFGYAYKF